MNAMSTIELTPEQEKLVSARDGSFLLVAPPGSGKTEIIAQRVVRLITATENQEFKVLALTFTKNAAVAMRTRVAERLGENSSRATITNYHSFCADILEHYGHLIGVPTQFTVYDSNDDRIQALVQALMAEGFLTEEDQLSRTEALEMLEVIGHAKRDLVPPQAPRFLTPVGFRFATRTAHMMPSWNGTVPWISTACCIAHTNYLRHSRRSAATTDGFIDTF